MSDLSATQQARQRWMGVLSKAATEDLNAHFDKLDALPEYSPLREPETGLVMVRGRTGGVGNRFNLGEMTVTRAAIRLESGETGVSYVAGRDKRHAEIAAIVDALMQSDAHRSRVAETVIEPLSEIASQKKTQTLRQRAATRVDFFTMTRTREDKK